MKKILLFVFFCVMILSTFGKSYTDSLVYCSPYFYYNIVDSTADGDSTIVQFYTYCDSLMVTHKWDFGDSTFSNEENPVHHFSQEHTVYQVCHEVIVDDISEYFCDEVQVIQHPLFCNADFSYEENTKVACICAGVFDFYDQSTGNIKSWSWDFGDGNGSEEQNPTHIYDIAGIYDVCLSIETYNGCHSYDHQFLIAGQPDCDIEISWNVLESYPPQYHFYSDVFDPRLVYSHYSHLPFDTDSSWYYLIIYNWDFGDGTSSDEPFPTHTYKNSGEYTVCLNVKYSNGTECEVCVTDYFEGGQIDWCGTRGTFYKSNNMCDHDFIITDEGQVLAINTIIPEIALYNGARIKFGYEAFPDTLDCYELDESVIITCIEVLYSECELTGTVMDYTGVDGCGYLIKLDNGTILEPVVVDTPFVFRDNQRVRLSYRELTEGASICMIGILAEITCIEETGDSIWPPPECEGEIILSTSFVMNSEECGGYASIDILSPCSAWFWPDYYDYSILWSTGETTSSIYGLCPGTLYFVTVTRSDGKTYTSAFSFFKLNSFIPAWSYYNSQNTYYFSLPVTSDYNVEWKFDDGTEANGTDIAYTFMQGGTHMVDLTVRDNEGNKVYSETIIISVVTNVKENSIGEIKAYPLPAGDILNIEYESPADFETSVILYNVAGQFLLDKKVSLITGLNHINLDVSDFKPGIYILMMNTPQGVIRHRINK
jgi:PKD repeat protein